ncbi:unnamed protein product [Meganyctiphanes norvegica]|uniref:UBP-type domain-containing protein n=1 Tax=Meganyctiphanes norvegica TaxID=48144 RepID=A0AAV2SHS9_MEGNR
MAEGSSGACGGGGVSTFLLVDNPEVETMHAVIPLEWCKHLESISPVPAAGISTSASCEECKDSHENWVCLHCYKVLCGRFVHEHMLLHGVSQEHYMVLSFSDLSVWCYACESYVHNDLLMDAKRAAHRDKFGEDIPNTN